MIELNPKYKPITTTDKRYIIVTGGRASAKSFSINTLKALYTYQKNVRVLFTRYTLTSAHISIIPEFQQAIENLEVEEHFDIQKTIITNKLTNSDIWFKGIKASSNSQKANLKSLSNVSSWVLDEAEELTDETTFDRIDLSIRTNHVQNHIILILNPTTQDHWIWTRFFENNHKYIDIDGHNVPISTHPDVLHIHTTYLDNVKHLSKSFLNGMERLKQTNPTKYKHVALGGWMLQQEGVIYDNWIEGKFDNNLPFCFGMDFGMSPDPTTCVKVAVDFKKMIIYCEEQFGDIELNNNVLGQLMANHCGQDNLIIGDSAEKRLINELRQKGFNIEKCVKRPLKERIRLIKNFQIVVTPESTKLKRELNNYVWNDKKASIPLSNGYDHYINAMEYAFERLSRGSIHVS